MDRTDEGNWTLLERYVAGELLLNDALRIEHWLATDRELQTYVTLMRAARNRTNRTGHGWDASAAFGRAFAQHTRVPGDALPSSSVRYDQVAAAPMRSFRRILIPVFTAATLLVAFGLGISRYAPSLTHPGLGAPATTIYSTRNAQRATITLPDGTEAVLNVASRLEVPTSTQNSSRNVTLKGSAFFRVLHKTAQPFTVTANGTRTRVLGTEFSVVAYGSDSAVVVVQTGRVAVNDAIVDAHEVAYAAGTHSPHVTREHNLDPWTGFTTGRLVLNKVPLGEAIAALNRWYDVDIRLSDARLEAYPMNAVLLSGSASELLEVLRVTFDVDVVRDGRIITLYLR